MNCLSCNLLARMVTIRSNRKFKEPVSVVFSAIFLLLVGNCQFVAASITWTAPPPQWTATNQSEIRTVNMSVLSGSTQEALKWSYTLPTGANPRTTRFHIIKGASKNLIGSISHDSDGDNFVIRDLNDYQTRFNISRSEVATLIINKVTEREEAVYQCELETKALDTWGYNIRVIVTVPVELTNVSGDLTVLEGLNAKLFCKATGRPQPNIILSRELEGGSSKELQQGPTIALDFLNIRRNDSGVYHCTADNGFTSDSKVLKVNVTYPAKIVKLVREHEVAAQQSVSLDCQAEGNPQPTYSWTPCDLSDSKQSVCHKSVLNFQASNKSVYTFTCKVENNLGSDAENTTLFIASDVINVTLVITGEECTDEEYNQLWKKLMKVIEKIFAGKLDYESVQLKSIRCGSVIVDLALKFSSPVREIEVLSILKDAVKNGFFKEFNVTAITGTRATGTTPTMTTTPTSSSDSTTWIIVGVVVGVVVVLAVAGGVVWYVYKKRKCKKRDSKVHNNGSQGEAGGNVQEEGCVQVNKGYEDRANRRSGGGNTSSAPPVLYDTAQTGNRGAAKGPPLPQYALVDKSKKKPKKPKPGELQYAELAEFSTGQGGQRSSLSPTNRATETQYADVNAM